MEDFKDVEQVIAYFKAVYEMVQTERKGLYSESWTQNQIDEIAQLVAETLYKLTLK